MNNINTCKKRFNILLNQKIKNLYGYIYTAPLVFWLTLFFVIPISIILFYSFLKKGLYAGVEYKFSLEAYKALKNPHFLKVMKDTMVISVISTIITVFMAMPTAYYIARSKYKSILLFLIIVPFWTSFLIRIFAWIAILGNNGFLNIYFMPYLSSIFNSIIAFFGGNSKISDSVQIMYTQKAIIIVTVYTYLPYAILPLYATIEKFDFSLIEAARDLGASKSQSIFKVLIPNIKVGITTAVLFTFIPSLGSYAIPKIVGGTEGSTMIGNRIDEYLLVARNWPLASAMAVVLTVATTIAVIIFVKMNENKAEATKNEKLMK